MPYPAQSKPWFVSPVLAGLLVFLFVSAVYLYAFPQPSVFYATVVLVHAVLGAIAAILLAVFLFRLLRDQGIALRVGWVLVAGGAVAGVILLKTGTPRVEWNLLYVHIL